MIDLIALPTRKFGAIWIIGALVAGALLVLTGFWQLQLTGGVLMLAALVSPIVYGGLRKDMESKRQSNVPTIKPIKSIDEDATVARTAQVNRPMAVVKAPYEREHEVDSNEELLDIIEKDGYRFLQIVGDRRITTIPRGEFPIEEAR